MRLMRAHAALAMACVAIGAGCAQAAPAHTSGSSPRVARATTARAAHPCGFKHTPPKTYRHVLWIFLENHAYDATVHSMPYLNGVGAKCGLARNYHSIGHPSLPNYIAVTSGGTHGINRDCEPTYCPVGGHSLFRQVTRHSGHWKGYADSMSGNCSRTSYGKYAARHNPAVYYNDVHAACAHQDVPLSSRSAGLRHDLSTNQLPRFGFITPNLCHDSHDCDLSVADTWLSKWMPRIFNSAAWSRGRTAFFVTFDEGEGDNQACAPSTSTNDSCHVATWVFAPSVSPHTRSNLHYTHYSLLRTTEQMLGINYYLGHAAHARSMRKAFGL